VLTSGASAPSFSLPDSVTGQVVSDPWSAGRTVIAFFKVTCPVCQMIAPKIKGLATSGVPVVAVGQDPPAALGRYADDHGQQVPTVTEAPPYPVSSAFGVSTVPTLFVVDEDGTIVDAVAGWDRDRWNAVAASFGAPLLSTQGDGLPVFRPG